jgi:uncharacterized Zn-finger protein
MQRFLVCGGLDALLRRTLARATSTSTRWRNLEILDVPAHKDKTFPQGYWFWWRSSGLLVPGGRTRRSALQPSVPCCASIATKASGSSASLSPPRASAAMDTSNDEATDLQPPVRGAPPGAMPTAEDQATGLERLELEYPDLFKHNEVIRGPFGTMDAPVMVESAYNSRIVGCTGPAAPNDHDLYWLEVRKDQPAVCPLCEQVFTLKQVT